MNLGKLSGLKSLMSSSSGKHRFKGDLTPEMISPPLGDFRHTMHVGRGGDVFGDTSFLSNHGGAGNTGDGDSITASEKSEGFFSRTMRYVRKTPDRPQGGCKALSPPPPPISPIIKNAISLPRLDMDSPNGNPVKVLFPSPPKRSEASTYSYGVDSGFVTLPRMSRTDNSLGSSGCSTQIHRSSFTDNVIVPHSCSDTLSPSNSITSFIVDLGPSLMSEVFSTIDNKVSEVEHELEPPFGWTNSQVEMCQDTKTSLVDSLLREDSEGRSCLYGVEWGLGDVINNKTPKRPIIGPGDSVQSYTTEEQVIEDERFQMTVDVLTHHYGSEMPKNTDMSCS
ncbi:hypothetical protein NFI96_015183 [Prochilodus magdalenae]|nr:hypothetical protein NFI96_015183 [Prochilodus magdalenae]